MALKSTFGLLPQRLASLLVTSSSDNDAPRDASPVEEASRLLRSRLACPLPLDEAGAESLPTVLGSPCDELKPLANRTMGYVLLDPATPLSVLEMLKEYGKELADRWEDGSERIVATAIYFAATARALVSHDRKLTARSYEHLANALGMLMGKPWITQELADLFASAHRTCESREQ